MAKRALLAENILSAVVVLGLCVMSLVDVIKVLTGPCIRYIGDVSELDLTRWMHFSDPEDNRMEIKEVSLSHVRRRTIESDIEAHRAARCNRWMQHTGHDAHARIWP